MNRLESSMSGNLNLIKINVKNPVAGVIATQLALEVTPTFIFFGSNGIEKWRSVGHLDPIRVQKSMLT